MVMPADITPPSLGFLVWHLSMKWRAQLDRELAPLGLTSAQYALLASLYGLTRGGARPSQRELATVSSLDAMYVSKLVRTLERAKLVQRRPNPADSRAVLLTVTPHGVRTVTAARATVLRLEEQRLAALGGRSSEQSQRLQETLGVLLRQATHASEQATEQEPSDGSATTG
jgi:DNA-binding MarR family transcriptional regulator